MFHRASLPSHLPSLIMPCPYCGHRMVVTSIEPTSSTASEVELEDVTHACKSCGTELIRTVSPEPKVAGRRGRKAAAIIGAIDGGHARSAIPASIATGQAGT